MNNTMNITTRFYNLNNQQNEKIHLLQIIQIYKKPASNNRNEQSVIIGMNIVFDKNHENVIQQSTHRGIEDL